VLKQELEENRRCVYLVRVLAPVQDELLILSEGFKHIF